MPSCRRSTIFAVVALAATAMAGAIARVGPTSAQTVSCGDGLVEGTEECDPGGPIIQCPPGAPAGAAFLPCNEDCTCSTSRLDHFQCYDVVAPRSLVTTVGLVDEFGTSSVTLSKARHLCAPSDKNGGDPTAPTDPEYLTAYDVDASASVVTRPDVVLVNQFGAIQVDVTKPVRLLVPTAASETGPPPALTSPIDHFQCYKVRRSRGSARFEHVHDVTVRTPFESFTVDVLKPTQLCVPVDKNGESPGAETHPERLVSYRVRASAPCVKRNVAVKNQFEDTTDRVVHVSTLNVPSWEIPRIAPTPVFDHFKQYGATLPKPLDEVTLTDQFFSNETTPLRKLLDGQLEFWTPVEKNREGAVIDPVTHMACYYIANAQQIENLKVTVQNQFGLQRLQINFRKWLCLPSEKDPGKDPRPLRRNHFKCYTGENLDPFKDKVVTLDDQFFNGSERETVTVHANSSARTIVFCAPVRKKIPDGDTTEIVDGRDHLTCYPFSGKKDPPAQHTTSNQFSYHEDVTLFRGHGLCVPTQKLSVDKK